MNENAIRQQMLRAGFSQGQIIRYLSHLQNRQAQSIVSAQPNQVSQVVPVQNSGDWSSFVSTAKDLAAKNDFPLSVLLGQAAVESARGKSAPGNNYFGIKGRGNAGASILPTQEADANGNYYNTNSSFAAYKSPADSIQSYINLIKNNYSQAYQYKDNPVAMLQAIKASGYATDPSYVNTVANTPEFKQNL